MSTLTAQDGLRTRTWGAASTNPPLPRLCGKCPIHHPGLSPERGSFLGGPPGVPVVSRDVREVSRPFSARPGNSARMAQISPRVTQPGDWQGCGRGGLEVPGLALAGEELASPAGRGRAGAGMRADLASAGKERICTSPRFLQHFPKLSEAFSKRTE